MTADDSTIPAQSTPAQTTPAQTTEAQSTRDGAADAEVHDTGDIGDTGDTGDTGVERGELIQPATEETTGEMVSEPAKVMRIGSMVKQLLEEVRSAPLDDASRERLAEIYERSIVELSNAMSPDLQQELKMLALPFKDGVVPSDAELRIAQAQLVGWLEGLFHGIQATLLAQQYAARQQLDQMRQLPAGSGEHGTQLGTPERPGTYL